MDGKTGDTDEIICNEQIEGRKLTASGRKDTHLNKTRLPNCSEKIMVHLKDLKIYGNLCKELNLQKMWKDRLSGIVSFNFS